MESKLFRKNTMERISSPERLQDYIRVTNPGIWMVLAAVIVLLAGLIVVSAMARVETTLPVDAEAAGGTIRMELPREDAEVITEGMPLRIGSREAKIEYVYASDARHITCTATLDIPDGTYEAEIVTDSVAPISFLIND